MGEVKGRTVGVVTGMARYTPHTGKSHRRTTFGQGKGRGRVHRVAWGEEHGEPC